MERQTHAHNGDCAGGYEQTRYEPINAPDSCDPETYYQHEIHRIHDQPSPVHLSKPTSALIDCNQPKRYVVEDNEWNEHVGGVTNDWIARRQEPWNRDRAEEGGNNTC